MKINTLNQKNNIKKYKKFKQNKRADHFIYDTAPFFYLAFFFIALSFELKPDRTAILLTQFCLKLQWL
ncbi:hypothetical protein, partial [Pedobacter jamesrossensis]